MSFRSIAVSMLTFGAAIATTPALAQDIEERGIRFGHLNNTDHPVSMGVKKFAEIVAAKCGGKMQVKEFPSKQLGTEQQQTSALQGGVQEMQSPATTSLVGIVKTYGVVVQSSRRNPSIAENSAGSSQGTSTGSSTM